MIEVLEFIFSSGWNFGGTLILLWLISNIFTGMIVIDKSVTNNKVD